MQLEHLESLDERMYLGTLRADHRPARRIGQPFLLSHTFIRLELSERNLERGLGFGKVAGCNFPLHTRRDRGGSDLLAHPVQSLAHSVNVRLRPHDPLLTPSRP